jgi:hypothetical protein
LEVFTAPYANVPDAPPPDILQYAPVIDKSYGLSIIVLTDQSGVDAFRIEADVTLASGETVHIDQSFRTFWGTFYTAGLFKSPVVGLSKLTITKQREDPPIEITLATDQQ